MSRLPPRIEQIIDGKKVEWWQILPLTDTDGIRYELSQCQKHDSAWAPIGVEYCVSAYGVENALLWKTLYASKDYIPFLETDVQEDFPVDFFLKDNMLVIKHEYYTENDRIFTIMKKDGDIKLKSPS